ncbi:hypothetical protein F8G81_03535 [Arthrobacter sp. CDRTa11]|uniref:hypothetical protein n=1 Tax=Arthrobacter sp. CDRTa11 TaxID=2651199 RepID=UPI002265846D|nr:hypothetical protein [Arthrobacter sp. CDRTa11]UZX01800.1 hypothetical protein F8G81_03535 [Arthrobacter sp. CDRTa11]
MTPSTSRVIRTVDEMLLDAGQVHADELRAALLALGSLGTVPAPAPNAELSALLAGGHDQLSHRRRLGRHRSGFVGLAVIAGMGLGVTGVAAGGPGGSQQASMSIQHLLEDWTPSWTIAAGTPGGDGGLMPAPADVPGTLNQPAPVGAEQRGKPAAPVPGHAAAQGGSPAAERAHTPARKTTSDDGSAEGGAPANRDAPDGGAAANGAAAKGGDSTKGQDAKGSEVQEALKPAAPTGKAGAGSGKPGPGAAWLKKFRR